MIQYEFYSVEPISGVKSYMLTRRATTATVIDDRIIETFGPRFAEAIRWSEDVLSNLTKGVFGVDLGDFIQDPTKFDPDVREKVKDLVAEWSGMRRYDRCLSDFLKVGYLGGDARAFVIDFVKRDIECVGRPKKSRLLLLLQIRESMSELIWGEGREWSFKNNDNSADYCQAYDILSLRLARRLTKDDNAVDTNDRSNSTSGNAERSRGAEKDRINERLWGPRGRPCSYVAASLINHLWKEHENMGLDKFFEKFGPSIDAAGDLAQEDPELSPSNSECSLLAAEAIEKVEKKSPDHMHYPS